MSCGPFFLPDEPQRRRALVADLRALAEQRGRCPTQLEVNQHFGKAWQVLARLFVGRRRHSLAYVNGYHRWLRLAGLRPNRRGWQLGRPSPVKGRGQVHRPAQAYAKSAAAQVARLTTALEVERVQVEATIAGLARRCDCGGIIKAGVDHLCGRQSA